MVDVSPLHYLSRGDSGASPENKVTNTFKIEINSPDRATLYVYPLDEDSIIIRYEPRNGIKRTYKKSGYGDLNRVLKTLYELTGNEIFNETIYYDN